MSLVAILLIPILSSRAQSAYKLIDALYGDNFFDHFTFEGGINESEAFQLGMINNTENTVYIGTDYTNVVYPRPSLYLYGKKEYDNGLVIIDINHLPEGCGTWPAFWMKGNPNWPSNGEIDIIEGINLFAADLNSLHTAPNEYAPTPCSFDNVFNSSNHNLYNFTGSLVSTNCTTWQAQNHSVYGGCSVNASNGNTYGHTFNENGGGVFAMELNDVIGIRVWFWLHNNVPIDIINKTPDPELNGDKWGTPFSYWPFGSWCNSKHFNNLQIIFDLNYCGWASYDPTWNYQCKDSNIAKGQTCEDFVKNNPSYFHDAYFNVSYVDVYQLS